MPSYSQRKTKQGIVYDARFRITNDNGVEVHKRLCGYPTKKAAQQAYLEFMKSYAPPPFKVQKAKNYIFDDLWALYKKNREAELAVSSFYDLNWIFDKFITPSFTGKSIPELKKADYAAWQADLWASKNPRTGEYYTQRYLTKIRSMLLTFLSWCEETYDIANQYKPVRKPKRKERKKEMLFWELSEFAQFEKAVDDVLWKTFFMSLFYSGARVGEILALTDYDVTFENGYYFFNINKGITRKTSNDQEKFLVTAPKTSTSNRKIQLPAAMTQQLNEYLAYKEQNKLPSDFFFGGSEPIPQRTYQRYFDSYTKLAGLKHIRIHDLRHSHASMLIHLNVPITVVSKRLGHSSVKMTLERYSHCYSDGETIAITALDEAISERNVP